LIFSNHIIIAIFNQKYTGLQQTSLAATSLNQRPEMLVDMKYLMPIAQYSNDLLIATNLLKQMPLRSENILRELQSGFHIRHAYFFYGLR
jgi:hypothetical protein